MLICDFNNVVKVEDQVGGNVVTEKEYIDLVSIMGNVELYEFERVNPKASSQKACEHVDPL